jgi:hypothetical protein
VKHETEQAPNVVFVTLVVFKPKIHPEYSLCSCLSRVLLSCFSITSLFSGREKYTETCFSSRRSVFKDASVIKMFNPHNDKHLATFEPIEEPKIGGNFEVDDNVKAGEQGISL